MTKWTSRFMSPLTFVQYREDIFNWKCPAQTDCVCVCVQTYALSKHKARCYMLNLASYFVFPLCCSVTGSVCDLDWTILATPSFCAKCYALFAVAIKSHII